MNVVTENSLASPRFLDRAGRSSACRWRLRQGRQQQSWSPRNRTAKDMDTGHSRGLHCIPAR